MLEHENTLLNTRMNWSFSAQGILFTAVVAVWDKSSWISFMISVIGGLSAFSICVSMRESNDAIDGLKERWKIFEDKYPFTRQYFSPFPTEALDPPRTATTAKSIKTFRQKLEQRRKAIFRAIFKGLFPWNFIPKILVIAWVLVIIIRAAALNDAAIVGLCEQV